MPSNGALAELGETDPELTARLEGELVVCGLHDARRASRVRPVLACLGSRRLKTASEPFAVAQAMTMLLAGRAAGQIAELLEETLERWPARWQKEKTRVPALPRTTGRPRDPRAITAPAERGNRWR